MWVLLYFQMPYGLKRNQETRRPHFLSFSCYRRQPFFSRESLCDMFLKCLERTPRRYRCHIYGYVVMPEHVYLLLSEPEVKVLATAIQALKVSFVRCSGRLHHGTFRQKRYFDCNVGDGDSFSEKLRYMHRNL
jgi:putative transposase